MPATQKIRGPSGPEFWTSFDPHDYQQVAEALKDEFQRSEPATDIHYGHSGPDHLPPDKLSGKLGFYCLHDCLVFLLRGVIFIDGQGALIEPGFAYRIKDEEWVGLGGNTTIFVMEEGDAKGLCAKKTKEFQEKYKAEEEAAARKAARPWNRVWTKFHRKEPVREVQQCATQ